MSYKTFDLAHDVASIISPMNEVVNIAGTVFNSGSGNVKTFTNIAGNSSGYWQTVYDSVPTSAQSTALFDITFGYSTSSYFYQPGTGTLVDEKTKIYRQMASMLLGDPDAVFQPNNSTTWNECFFILIKRGIMKDELKKGSISLALTGTGAVTISDAGAATAFKQTVGGDYANLVNLAAVPPQPMGMVFYNAGVIVLSTSGSSDLQWFSNTSTPWNWWGSYQLTYGPTSVMLAQDIDAAVEGLRDHIPSISFHNQTNLYSTIYFCRATNTDFNYSSNPTYLDTTGRIRVTSGSNVLQSRTYITTVGLYDASDNLLAVGKVNKPISKSPDTESIFRVRIDY